MEIAIRMGLEALQNAGTGLMRHFDHMQANHRHSQEAIAEKIHHIVLDSCAYSLEKNKQHAPIFMAGDEKSTLHKQWVLLPIEGISLYHRKIPEFCLALQLKKDQQTHAVIVYNPIHQEYYSAVKGHGAYGNDQRLRVAEPNAQRLLIGVPQSEDMASIIPLLNRITEAGHDFYLIPSLSMLAAHCAASRVDAIIAPQPSSDQIDVSSLLLREAGALLCNFQGEPSGFEKGFIAGHAKVMKQVVEFIHRG